MPQTLFENYEDAISPTRMDQTTLDTNLIRRWDVITRYVRVPRSNNVVIGQNSPLSLHCTWDDAAKYTHWQFVGSVYLSSNNTSLYFHPRYSSSNNTHINNGPNSMGTMTYGFNQKRAMNGRNDFARIGPNNNTYLPEAGSFTIKMAGLMQHTNQANKGFVTYWVGYEAYVYPLGERGCVQFNNTNMLYNNNSVRFTGLNFYTLNNATARFYGYLMGLRNSVLS